MMAGAWLGRCWRSTRWDISRGIWGEPSLTSLQHMNLVLADCDEYRTVKRKAKVAPGQPQSVNITEEKRALGLAIVRGAHVVSCSVEGPPPPDPAARLAAPAGPTGSTNAMTSGAGTSRPAGRGAGPGLQGPAPGVGAPGFPPMGGPPGFPPGGPPGFAGRGGPRMSLHLSTTTATRYLPEIPAGFPGGPPPQFQGGPPPGRTDFKAPGWEILF